MIKRPILANSCAAAASAAEARYRIVSRYPRRREARVIGLDDLASQLVAELAQASWRSAHFLFAADGSRRDDEPSQFALRAADGTSTTLADELVEADFVMMIATAGDDARAAATIGLECAIRGIMTAAVLLGHNEEMTESLQALRPYARVLLISEDRDDAAELLTAVGA